MKKTVSVFKLSLFIFFAGIIFTGVVKADWWERPSERPTQPAVVRDGLPTTPPQPTQPSSSPTQPPVRPTATPTPRIGGLPTSTPVPTSTGSGGGGGTTEDPCAPGKSFTGPHCGWSPGVGGGEGGGTVGGGGQGGAAESRVLGLSYTSGEDLTLSDIMLLAGALCLLMYIRSKVSIRTR